MFKILGLIFSLLISLNLMATILTPTEKVEQSLVFSDDLNFENLELAIDRQMESLKHFPMKQDVRYGQTIYSAEKLSETLTRFKEVSLIAKKCLETNGLDCLATFNTTINTEFDIYRPLPEVTEPGFESVNTTLYTAYYSPDFVGSHTKTERFKNPIYALPTDPSLARLTREQIDFDHMLDNKGLELVWVEESLFDIYILHVEGGGRVRIPQDDGREEKFYLSFAGANGHKFNMVKHYMIEAGMIKPSEASLENQEKYLEDHPEIQREVYASNPSYIFFKPSNVEPEGVNSIILTENRSLAIDTSIYKHVGIINFVVTKKAERSELGPVVQREFSRFFISQDTGGAIRGNARCDLYFGFGKEAQLIANNTKSQGLQYFLIKKN